MSVEVDVEVEVDVDETAIVTGVGVLRGEFVTDVDEAVLPNDPSESEEQAGISNTHSAEPSTVLRSNGLPLR